MVLGDLDEAELVAVGVFDPQLEQSPGHLLARLQDSDASGGEVFLDPCQRGQLKP
jgi:hypothetical protein